MNVPEELLHNSHFNRYYRTWKANPFSIVFIPLAQICREYGFLEEAREICEKGLAHNPHSVSGRLMLARVRLDMGKGKGAREVLEEVLNEFPGQDEAKKLLDKIPETGHAPSSQKPLSPWDNVTMAQIYASQGEAATARQILEKVLAKNPQDLHALALRQELLR